MNDQLEPTTPTKDASQDGIRGWFAGLNPRWRKRIKWALGAVFGAAAGFAVYTFTGCDSGGCSLSRDPYVSMTIGSVMGVLVAEG